MEKTKNFEVESEIGQISTQEGQSKSLSSLEIVKKRKRTNSESDKRNKNSRVRTPSRTVLTNSVKDIRNFFTPNKFKKSQSTGKSALKRTSIKAKSGNSVRCESASISKQVSGQIKRKFINKSKVLKNRTQKTLG